MIYATTDIGLQSRLSLFVVAIFANRYVWVLVIHRKRTSYLSKSLFCRISLLLLNKKNYLIDDRLIDSFIRHHFRLFVRFNRGPTSTGSDSCSSSNNNHKSIFLKQPHEVKFVIKIIHTYIQRSRSRRRRR